MSHDTLLPVSEWMNGLVRHQAATLSHPDGTTFQIGPVSDRDVPSDGYNRWQHLYQTRSGQYLPPREMLIYARLLALRTRVEAERAAGLLPLTPLAELLAGPSQPETEPSHEAPPKPVD
ncbi:MAG: hypothetical protein HYX52_05760 [Chloroflexi bacterium]|nr:hypothetical protein [Chloroflexota bacterium]